MRRSVKILIVLFLGCCLFSTIGCKTTKYGKVGLDLKYSGGDFKLQPKASIGVTGKR